MITIPNYSSYAITENGQVWSKRTCKWLKPGLGTNGYFFVVLRKNRKSCSKEIHRLVLETYVGKCPIGMECRHLNSNPRDNRLENLCWGTRVENRQDSIKQGTFLSGTKHPNSKFTDYDIRMIIYMWRTGLFLQKEIAKIYNICQQKVSQIVNKKRYKILWQ